MVRTLSRLCHGARPYSLYVLGVLMVVYLTNQMDRFLLGVASRDIAHDLHFAQFGCFPDTTSHLPRNSSCIGACIGIKNETEQVCSLVRSAIDNIDYLWLNASMSTPTVFNYGVLGPPTGGAVAKLARVNTIFLVSPYGGTIRNGVFISICTVWCAKFPCVGIARLDFCVWACTGAFPTITSFGTEAVQSSCDSRYMENLPFFNFCKKFFFFCDNAGA